MAVKILIRRRVVKNKETQLVPLLIELRAKATTQPGFISGETLRNVENAEECLMISTWKSPDAWNAWMHVPEGYISDCLSVLSIKAARYIYIHEHIVEKERWINSLSLIHI